MSTTDLISTATKTGSVTVNTATAQRLFIGGDNDTAPDRLFGIVDEIRLWDEAMSATNLVERYDRELDPASEPTIVAYWRFEPDSSAGNYVDKVGSFPLTASDGEFVRPGAPLTLPMFEVAGTGSSALLKTNFNFVSTEGTTKGAGYSVKQARGTRLNERIPVVRFAPAGVVAIEEGEDTTVAIEVVGDHDSPSLRFEAVFDASISPQLPACDGFTVSSPCVFDATNNSVVIGAACPVPEGATLVNCTIDTNPIGGEQGDRFASIRIKEDPTGSYKTVPGDKLTLQIYETCELSGSSGHTAMLLDVGTMNGQDFINQRSYVTYSWEAASSSENVEYIFGSGGGSKVCSGSSQDKVRGSLLTSALSPSASTSPRSCSEHSTTTTTSSWVSTNPTSNGQVETDGWNNSCFSSRYQFSTSASDSSEECSSIGMTEQAMCNTVQDRDSVQVCDSPSNSTKYCYVEFKISNMPTDPSKFVKLDESNEYSLPSSLEGMKGTNRWGGGYTDGFVVDLDTDNVSVYGTNTGNPLMEVISRAGMDFWFLQTKPNDADGGKSVKLVTGETDAVRYRMATARVCS